MFFLGREIYIEQILLGGKMCFAVSNFHGFKINNLIGSKHNPMDTHLQENYFCLLHFFTVASPK